MWSRCAARTVGGLFTEKTITTTVTETAGLTTVILDTFTVETSTNLEDHTPDTGSGYTLLSGTTNALRARADLDFMQVGQTSISSSLYSNGTTVAADNRTTFDMIFNTGTASSNLGVVFRGQDANNHYRLLYARGSKVWALERVVGGSVTQLALLSYDNDGGSATIVIDVTGTGSAVDIDISIDGVPNATLSHSDTDANRITSAGFAGFRAYRASGAAIDGIDNFKVEA